MEIPTPSSATEVEADDVLDVAVRFGMVAYALLHLVVAWTALQIVIGGRGASNQASSTGALRELAQSPLGVALVWAVAVGFVTLVIWMLTQAVAGFRDLGRGKRLLMRSMSVGKAVIYGALAWSAARVALGSGSSSGTDSATQKLMDAPAGPYLVGAVGVAIVIFGGRLMHQAFSEQFRRDLEAQGQRGATGATYIWLGKLGYTGKGLAMWTVGYFFGYAAVTHDPHKSAGLDQALTQLATEPYGDVLLLVVVAGLASFGLHSFAYVRHLDH